MSMGYSACFTEHVSDDNLKKILGDEADKLDQLKKLIDDCENECTDDLVRYLDDGDIGGLNDAEADGLKQLKKLWAAIQKRVKKETGLKLYINYHDSSDNGSCYDDVDGVFFDFAHGELYKPSAKFQKLRKKFGKDVVERQFFVEFG